MRRLTCLLLLGAALAAGPVLAQVRGTGTAVVVSPAMSRSSSSRGGCTDINPCAVVTPALGLNGVSLPIPERPSQPDSSAAADAPAGDGAAAPVRAAAANPACPPAGARGGQGARGPGGGQRGGQFGGRGPLTDAQREAFRRQFAQAGGRGFGGAGRGAGGNGAARGGNGQQFAQNGGRGQGAAGFARGGNGCPPVQGGQGRGRGGDGAAGPSPQ